MVLYWGPAPVCGMVSYPSKALARSVTAPWHPLSPTLMGATVSSGCCWSQDWEFKPVFWVPVPLLWLPGRAVAPPNT